MPCGSSGEQYERHSPVSRRSALSYTVQRFRPKSPPYAGRAALRAIAVGYVELPGEIIIEARISDVPFDQLCLGSRYPWSANLFSSKRAGRPFLPMHSARQREQRNDGGFIVGAGIHPFGRTVSRSGLEQGVYAVDPSAIRCWYRMEACAVALTAVRTRLAMRTQWLAGSG